MIKILTLYTRHNDLIVTTILPIYTDENHIQNGLKFNHPVFMLVNSSPDVEIKFNNIYGDNVFPDIKKSDLSYYKCEKDYESAFNKCIKHIFFDYYHLYKDKYNYNGIYTKYYKNGKNIKHRFYYNNNKIEGLSESFYENSNIKKRINYIDGKLNGLYEEYYKNGNIMKRANYINGLIDGISREYYENGKIKKETLFCSGKLNGLSRVYYVNGDVKIYYEYKLNKKLKTICIDRNLKFIFCYMH
jgi:hypothetical protein